MPKAYVRENVPLSRFGVLVAQLESIVTSSAQQPPEPLLCFDLLSDLIFAIDEEPKESIVLWQRKCEDALYSLLTLGARKPVRHLASVAMAKIISKGDPISIYSRVSSLQGFLSDGKRNEPQKVAGVMVPNEVTRYILVDENMNNRRTCVKPVHVDYAAELASSARCLGELYRHFGRRITSGLFETTTVATKLIKYPEEFVRQEALSMLQNALEGSGGNAASVAYTDAYRLITRFAIGDKSFVVRIAAARCLKVFAIIGGPGLAMGELENAASYCVKALEDPVSAVRDTFADALGSLLALGMNPDAQVQPRGKGPFPPAKKLEGGLQRYLCSPFIKVSGPRSKDVRVGLTLSWVFFLQAIRIRYQHPDSELQDFALHVMDMLRNDNSADAHALACVLYIIRVGVTDQMTEPTQRSFLVFLAKQLQTPDATSSMKVAALHTLSYTLKTLGEVPSEFKEMLDDTVVAAVSHSSQLVRIEAALTLRALVEVDPTCVGGLISYGVTSLSALRENLAFEKGSNLQPELDFMHGQTAVLAALVSISPTLPFGYPARLPRSVLEVSKKMLTESSKNSMAAIVENEAGWLLLSSLLASMPKEELEDQVFDILSLWAAFFTRNPEHETRETGDLASKIRMWSAAVDALTAFLRCFISSSSVNNGVLLQPVLLYLSRALSYISLIAAKEVPNVKPDLDTLIIRTLIAYQSIPDSMAYKNDHPKIIQLCTMPFRDASRCEESTCLRLLLDKRDAWLGPWIPGRDWFEDELRAFQGEKDGLMPCVWENDISSFPQPEPINKTLVNQMLLCFGIMFASQDNGAMLSLLGLIEQCLKAGKKQSWHGASVTNICVGLLAGFKALLSLRPRSLGDEILNSAQAIFQSILAEEDICASKRRASAEGLGLLARLGNDVFTARMTRLLFSDLTGATESNYAGSIALALGCIHHSAGGMALSTLVPATVNSISLLAKSTNSDLQLWSLHGLLLTIEAAGLSYVSHVQATLGLALDILLSEENGWFVLQQGVGRIINAVVAVLGPELAPGSIFFSRCKSVIAEISSGQEMATMLENVRFTQQLVLFAPQAVSVHSHVQTLTATLSSRQPALRHLAISTLRHLIEKDPVSVIDEQIEEDLFSMLDEETDSEIGDLVRATVMRLLYASCPSFPSRWILICRNVVLATSTRRDVEKSCSIENDPPNGTDGDSSFSFGHDEENMVSSSRGLPEQGHTIETSHVRFNRDKHLRYRTRIFAAECLSLLPEAVGKSPAHFDLSLARKHHANGRASGDWLVLHVQDLISLAYQISTIQLESMQPIGVGLLSTIIDKFEGTPDPELPGHLLLEQYQAQLVSAVRTALASSSGPILLEAGLKLATKILTNGIIKSDQAAVRRIFSLISRPLNDFKDLYYPSFAEWVSCKIKIRLLAAHASLKCYTYAFLWRHQSAVPDEYLGLLPLFSKSSSILGNYWIGILQDYCYTCLSLHLKKKRISFLDGIQSSLVSSKLRPSLEESWPVILQAVALDAVPANPDGNRCTELSAENESESSLLSGYNMVELQLEEYRFLWGFSLLVLFQGHHSTPSKENILLASVKSNHDRELPTEELNPSCFYFYEIVLPVFQFLSTKRFASVGFLTIDICKELLQIFSYSIYMDNSWDSLSVSVLSQILQNCPKTFFETENFAYLAMELCLGYLLKVSTDAISRDHQNKEDLMSSLFITAKTLVKHFDPKKQLISVALAFLLIGYKCVEEALNDSCFSKIIDYFKCTNLMLKKLIVDKCEVGDDGTIHDMRIIIGACLNAISNISSNCIKRINQLGKRSSLRTLLQSKLALSLEQAVLLAKLVNEMEYFGESRDRDPTFCSIFRSCSDSVRTVLTDSNIQVQAIGLQMLKGMVQKGTIEEDYSFVMFVAGEFVSVIFLIIQTMLKKPTKESATLAGECLRFLVLLQTTARESEYQRAYMNLLLEAIIMVILASEGGPSQDLIDIRSTAIRVVSHLAQIPSSAVYFKDALLSMPVTHRQHLQGFIRASVTHDQNAVKIKSATPSLGIQLPLPTAVSKENHSPPAPEVQSNKDIIEEDEEDEDDWDNFQSFSTAGDGDGANFKFESDKTETAQVEKSPASENNIRSDCLQEQSGSEPPLNLREKNDGDHEVGEEDVRSDSLSNQMPSQGDIPLENIEVEESGSTHGSTEGNLVYDHEPSKENLDDKTETVKSDVKVLDEEEAYKEHEQVIESEKSGRTSAFESQSDEHPRSASEDDAAKLQ